VTVDRPVGAMCRTRTDAPFRDRDEASVVDSLQTLDRGGDPHLTQN
jgi:hypothetical protein